jgi:ATP phosphoribosyltransferase
VLKIAVPNKGRLSESTLELFQKAGLKLEAGPERKLYALALDRTVQILFLRAQDIPEFVQDGVAHLGVTGEDIVQESGKAVKEVMDLQYGYCRLVVAVPEKSPIRDARDVPDGARVATSFPRLTRAHFDKMGKKIRVVEVSGATELTPHIGVADLVTDLTSSGSTLAMNGLREVGTIVHSTARVITNEASWADAKMRPQMDHVLATLASVVAARGKRYLMANVPKSKLDDVRRLLPGISGPTIMDILSHPELVAAHAVVDESSMLSVVNGLKALGATGILVLPIERLVP